MDIVHKGRRFNSRMSLGLYSHELLLSCLKHEVTIAIGIRESKDSLWI